MDFGLYEMKIVRNNPSSVKSDPRLTRPNDLSPLGSDLSEVYCIEKIEIICIHCIQLRTNNLLLECPTYDNLRRKYIKQFYWKIPSVYKVIVLLSVKNIKELNQLSKYIYECNKLRVT